MVKGLDTAQMEYFDIVDENGWATGETVERTEAHEKGIRHRTAHIWITRVADGITEVLLQKRSMDKDSFPGRYDTSSAGHIKAGGEPLEEAGREMEEELGLSVGAGDLRFIGKFSIAYEKEFHGKIFRDSEVAFVYLYDKPVEISDLTLQKEELESVEWFSLSEVYRACSAHDERFCVPMGGLKVLMEYLGVTPYRLEIKVP